MIDTDKYERRREAGLFNKLGCIDFDVVDNLLAEVKRLNMVINMLRKNDLWVSQEGWEESDKDDELIVSMDYLIQASLELRGD